MEKIYYELANIVRERREELGLSQREVAERLGVTRSTYANWEQVTRRIDISSMLQICDLLKLDPTEVTKELRKHINK